MVGKKSIYHRFLSPEHYKICQHFISAHFQLQMSWNSWNPRTTCLAEMINGDRLCLVYISNVARLSLTETINGDRLSLTETINGDRLSLTEMINGDRLSLTEIINGATMCFTKNNHRWQIELQQMSNLVLCCSFRATIKDLHDWKAGYIFNFHSWVQTSDHMYTVQCTVFSLAQTLFMKQICNLNFKVLGLVRPKVWTENTHHHKKLE